MLGSFWEKIDEVHISSHPGHELSGRDFRLFKRRARDHGVKLVLRYADEFREPYAESGTGDNRLIHRIYDTCQIAHSWQCHAVFEGYFYRCFQSVLIPRILLGQTGADLVADGLRLSNRGSLGNELRAFLADSKPPKSCRYCLGTSGLPIRVRQERRWPKQAQRTTEELVDWKHLANFERGNTGGMAPFFQVASRLLKRGLSIMTASIQVHPAVMGAIARMRKIHHIWQ
jgi:hypothetical protein